ncbi:MAG: hypothetical protein ACON4Z_09175 [Planctomycetota bacterium]
MILGGVGALALIVALVLMSSGSGGDAEPDQGARQPQRSQPAAPAAATPTDLKMASASAGKPPGRPAPTLTREMLQKANVMVDAAKALNNEGTRLRNAGDNRGARSKQSEAKRKLDEAIEFLAAPSAWQEEADLEGWAMPAEYVTLGNLYVRIAKYQKRIRMGGGK